MKKSISLLLAILILISCQLIGSVYASAATKLEKTRTIAIVFDNSGSMYVNGQQAWCRATYAMEVFATMLNDGDTLLIYPMNPITVDGEQYTSESPLKITDPNQASLIRKIYTARPSITPIESIDAAAQGLQAAAADEKWLIVLSDGAKFYMNGKELTTEGTESVLSSRFNTYVDQAKLLYLGIGAKAAMPSGVNSKYFYAEKASDSKDILSVLTKMCNQIFGRDTLPAARNKNGEISFDISLNKMIVFVQGEDVSNVSVTGADGTVGNQLGAAEIRYAEDGCNPAVHKPVADTSLQGMLVTYADCAAGDYKINYSGNATSIEVYYEPNVDLDFVFTDSNGNSVDPNTLYEGDYKVSFGMKDGKTGELVSSDMLGNPQYHGSYSINGEQFPIDCNGMSGEVPVSLKIGDTFDAQLNVTYLSGYSIEKNAEDFGWPAGGLTVAAWPCGELRLEISGGDSIYMLQTLEEGTPYTAKVFYEDQQLTGAELQSTLLKWDPSTSNAIIKQTFADDHYDLSLHYNNPDSPTGTVLGECTVTIYAFYTPKASTESEASAQLTYTLEKDDNVVSVMLDAPQDYFVVSQLEDGESLKATVTVNGEKLTDAELAAVDFQVDCGGIEHTVTPILGESAFAIKLKPTEGIETKDYKISATANVTDELGRTTSGNADTTVTLSKMPLWLRTLIILLLILLLLVLLFFFLNQKVLPKYIKRAPETDFTIGGRTIDDYTNLKYNRSVKTLELSSPSTPLYVDVSCSVKLGLKPVSPRRTSSAKRKAEVITVRAAADISSIDVGSATYTRDDSGSLVKEGGGKTIIQNRSLIVINGVATTTNNKKKSAVLSQQLIFK